MIAFTTDSSYPEMLSQRYTDEESLVTEESLVAMGPPGISEAASDDSEVDTNNPLHVSNHELLARVEKLPQSSQEYQPRLDAHHYMDEESLI